MHIFRALLVMVMAIAQVGAAFAPQVLGWSRTVGSSARLYESPLVPAGYAFAIWGPLFLGCLFFAIWQMASPRRRESEVGTVGWLAFGAFTAITVWSVHQPLFGPGPLSFAVLEVVLLFAFLAALFTRKIDDLSIGDRLAVLPLFALAGWLLVASPGGLSLAMRSVGVEPFLGSLVRESSALMMVWLVPASVLAFFARSAAFLGAVVWGVVAVIVANQGTGETLFMQVLYLAAGIMTLATVMGILAARRSPPEAFEESR
ncbi:MAG: hypothetical protein AAFX52_02975 [Pseudomonadota bacterium]